MPFPVIIKDDDFLLQQMETDAESDSQTRGDRVQMGQLHQIPPLRAQGTPWRKRQKEHKSQRGRRTPCEQGFVNELSNEHMSSQRLKQASTGTKWVCARSSVYIL